MILVVSGTRDAPKLLARKWLDLCMTFLPVPTLVIAGESGNVDKAAKEWANERNFPYKGFPAKWAEYGRPAGPSRNAEMADLATVGIAVWNGESSGTGNLIENMCMLNKPMYIHVFNQYNPWNR